MNILSQIRNFSIKEIVKKDDSGFQGNLDIFIKHEYIDFELTKKNMDILLKNIESELNKKMFEKGKKENTEYSICNSLGFNMNDPPENTIHIWVQKQYGQEEYINDKY